MSINKTGTIQMDVTFKNIELFSQRKLAIKRTGFPKDHSMRKTVQRFIFDIKGNLELH
jgi:hypothetical protein